jgi:hypothetical protein
MCFPLQTMVLNLVQCDSKFTTSKKFFDKKRPGVPSFNLAEAIVEYYLGRCLCQKRGG